MQDPFLGIQKSAGKIKPRGLGGYYFKFLASSSSGDSDDQVDGKVSSMKTSKKKKMLAISRRFTAEIEAVLEDSPEAPFEESKRFSY